MDLLIGGVTWLSWFFSFFGPETVSSVVVFFLHCSEYLPGGKTRCFFFSLVTHFIWGQSLVLGVPFLALPVLTFLFRMGIPGFLPRSIDVKVGDFPDDVSGTDIVKSLLDFFEENADFKVVAVQQCPNKIARVTFEEGGRQLRLIL